MSDSVNFVVTGDTTQYQNEMKKAAAELARLNGIEVTAISLIEKVGKSLDSNGNAATTFAVKIEGINKEGLKVSQTYQKLADDLDKFEKVAQKVSRITPLKADGKLQSWKSQAIEARIDSQVTPLKVNPKDMVDYNAAMTQLKQLVSAYNGGYREIKDVWKNLELGNPQKLTGDLAKIQAGIQRVISLRDKMSAPDLTSYNDAKKKTDELKQSVDKASAAYDKMHDAALRANAKFDAQKAVKDARDAQKAIDDVTKANERMQKQQVKRDLANQLKEISDKAKDAKASMDALHLTALKEYSRNTLAQHTNTLLPGKGAAPDTVLNLATAKNKLADFLAENMHLKAQVNKVWSDVANGQIKQYEGSLHKLQTLMFELRMAHAQTGHAAGHSQDAALKQSMELSGHLEAQRRKLMDLSFSWQTMFRLVVSQGASRALAEITHQMSMALDESLKLSKQLAAVTTVDKTNMSSDSWASNLRKLNEESGLGMLDTAKAAYQALSNQVGEGARNLGFLKDANDLAIVGLSTSTQAVDLLSSAINSYGLDISETKEVAAKFFKIAELGRVTIPEMSESLGRLAPLGAQVGVSLDELGASIDVITMKGVKYEVASTFLRNTLMKFSKPTESMKEWFNELGYATGEAMIKSLGWGGVLAELEKKAKGSSAEFADLFKDIRAISGATLMAGRGLRLYNEDLAAIGKATETYDAQVNKLKDTLGHDWDVAGEKIKDIFTLDMMTPFLDQVSDGTNRFQAFVDVVADARPVVTALMSAGIVPLLYGAARATTALYGIAMGAAAFHPVTVAIMAMVGALAFATVGVESLEEKSKKFHDSQLEAYNKRADEIQRLNTKEVREADEKQREELKPLRKALAEKTALINAQLKEQEGLEKKLKDAIVDSEQAKTAAINKTIDATKERLSSAKRDIEQLKKATESAFKDILKMKLEQSLTGKSDAAKIPVLDQEISRLKTARNAAAESNDIEKFKEYSSQLESAYRERNSAIESGVKDTSSILDKYRDAVASKQDEIAAAERQVQNDAFEENVRDDKQAWKRAHSKTHKAQMPDSVDINASSEERKQKLQQLIAERDQLQNEYNQAQNAVASNPLDKYQSVSSINGSSDTLKDISRDVQNEHETQDRLSSNETLKAAQSEMIAAKEEEQQLISKMQQIKEQQAAEEEATLEKQRTLLEDVKEAYTGIKSIRDSELSTQKEIEVSLQQQLAYAEKIEAIFGKGTMQNIRAPLEKLQATNLAAKKQKDDGESFREQEYKLETSRREAEAFTKRKLDDLTTAAQEKMSLAEKIRVARPSFEGKSKYNTFASVKYLYDKYKYDEGEAVQEKVWGTFKHKEMLPERTGIGPSSKVSVANIEENKRDRLEFQKIVEEATQALDTLTKVDLTKAQVVDAQAKLKKLQWSGKGDYELGQKIQNLASKSPDDVMKEQRDYQAALADQRKVVGDSNTFVDSLKAYTKDFVPSNKQAVSGAQQAVSAPVTNTLNLNLTVDGNTSEIDWAREAKKAAPYFQREMNVNERSNRAY